MTLLFLALLGPGHRSHGAQPTTPESAWRVWLEARFMRIPGAQPVAGAEKTVLVGGTLENGEYQPWSDVPAKAGVPWEEFVSRARKQADTDLASLQITYERNRKGVILYATVQSAEGRLASAVLAPGFARKFENTLGPDLLVVVPSRQQAFVFPKLASEYQAYGELVYEAFREDTAPVSLEVFELTAAGLRTIGRYPDPARD